MLQPISTIANIEGAEPGIPTISGEPPAESVQAQLARILASSSFSRSERLSRFLRFVVEEKIAGRTRELKEYTIGTQVYDRSASFDPTTDTIVRVEARRLRVTLQNYYASEGRSDPVRIDVPKGGYEPVFAWKVSFAVEPDLALSQFCIAVLPFENFGLEGDQESFCDGLTEEIIHALAQVEGLRVVARTSAFAFKRRRQDVRSIGEALNAGTVVEGSVRREGEWLRITAQLINVSDGYHLWSHRFDREVKGLLAIQDEIARTVTDELRVRLAGAARPRVEKLSSVAVHYHSLVSG